MSVYFTHLIVTLLITDTALVEEEETMKLSLIFVHFIKNNLLKLKLTIVEKAQIITTR